MLTNSFGKAGCRGSRREQSHFFGVSMHLVLSLRLEFTGFRSLPEGSTVSETYRKSQRNSLLGGRRIAILLTFFRIRLWTRKAEGTEVSLAG